MLHKNRTWKVTDVDPNEVDELARKLAEQTWTRCSGWRCGNLLLLNDSTGPDGAQEYAAVDADTGEQIESITFSWCTPKEARENIEMCARYVGGIESPPMRSGYWIDQIETPDEHGRCELCR